MSEQTRLQLVFSDTNVLIQGRPLHELPWQELGGHDIEVTICGPVIRELDRLKNKGGRAGRVARAMSSTVRDLMIIADKSDVLRETSPRVTRRLLLGLSVSEPVRTGLDLTQDDQLIINQALAQLDAGNDVIFLTDDNFAAMTAEEYGLPVKLMPAHWLKEPEIDDSGKEIAHRDAEIARLKSAEPSLQLHFANTAGELIKRLEVTMTRYLPVSEVDVDRLVQRVVDAAPLVEVQPTETMPAESKPPAGSFDIIGLAMAGKSFSFIPVTQDNITKYQVDHSEWLKWVQHKITNFHHEWNQRREWPSAQMLAMNSGTRPAENVLVEINASGRFTLSGRRKSDNKGPAQGTGWLSLNMPPEPPRVRRRKLASSSSVEHLLKAESMRDFSHLNRLLSMPGVRDDDSFYWRSGKTDPVGTMELDCKIWRHGREEEGFSFHIWATDDQPVAGLIVGRVSASNLTQAVEVRLPVRINFRDKDTSLIAEQLVEEFERCLKIKREA